LRRGRRGRIEVKLRKSGIDIIGDVPWGTHFCQFYQTKEDSMDILVPYFKAGLENNEFCIWIAAQALEVEEAKEALKKAVPDFDVYLESRQIEIVPYTHWYVKDSVFDSKKILNSWVEKTSHALASGYDGLRLSLNTFWLEETDFDYFADYEREVDSIIGKHHMIALCTYPLDKCNAIGIIYTVSSHQFVLSKKDGKWERIEKVGKKTAIRSAEEDEIKLGEALDNPEKLPKRLIQLEKDYISLKESEKGLTEAQRMVHLGSWDLDISTEESKWSDEMHRIFGLDPQKFGPTDKTFLRYVHPEDRKYVNDAIQDALRGKPYSIDYRIILANGDESAVHEHREITFDKKDIPVRIIGTVQDIAERKKIEKAFKIARDYNRSLIDSSLDLLFVTDPDGKITDANKAAEKATGYLREELIGTDFINYFTDPEQARKDYQQALRERSVLNWELEIKHKDGQTIPVLYNSSVRMDESGEIIGAVASAHDITERKKTEETLKIVHDSLEEKVKERTAELEEAYESLK
jgi:PAS domain S-box-containing protein